MPRKFRNSRRKSVRKTVSKSFSKRYGRSSAVLSRRISYLSKKVAGEKRKFELTPDIFQYNNIIWNPTESRYEQTGTVVNPLTVIGPGTPWVMPLNWVYTNGDALNPAQQVTIDGITYTGGELPSGPGADPLEPTALEKKYSAFYNTVGVTNPVEYGTQLQYRMSSLYINACFRSSLTTPASFRAVVVCDKQPSMGPATWYDPGDSLYSTSRSVFSSGAINAMHNPRSAGRFVTLYDKMVYLGADKPIKMLKIYKKFNIFVRNSRINPSDPNGEIGTDLFDGAHTTTPVQKNAFYLMILSVANGFNYNVEPGLNQFNLTSRISYYDN